MKSFDVKALAFEILNEHPQAIAYTLALLDEKTASNILQEFPDYLHMDIIYRLSSLQEIKPAVAKKLEDDLKGKIMIPPIETVGPLDGLKKAARILNLLEHNIIKNVLKTMNDVYPDKAIKIRESLKTEMG